MVFRVVLLMLGMSVCSLMADEPQPLPQTQAQKKAIIMKRLQDIIETQAHSSKYSFIVKEQRKALSDQVSSVVGRIAAVGRGVSGAASARLPAAAGQTGREWFSFRPSPGDGGEPAGCPAVHLLAHRFPDREPRCADGADQIHHRVRLLGHGFLGGGLFFPLSIFAA